MAQLPGWFSSCMPPPCDHSPGSFLQARDGLAGFPGGTASKPCLPSRFHSWRRKTVSDVAIRAEGLSKEYRLRGGHAATRTLSETISEAFSAPLRRALGRRRAKPSKTKTEDRFWALRDVSFEIRRGEALGIIGHNGAGKSTLLRILSRITNPTSGRATVYGRVGALLEVGTGFHGELTGRENIYLAASILGMKRPEIRRQFDAIVEFAE